MKKLPLSYRKDLLTAIANTINIEILYGKNILITGVTGLIGSFLVDLLLELNDLYNANIEIFALARNEKSARERFEYYRLNKLHFIFQDVCEEINLPNEINYVVHAAGDGYPEAFRIRPVETMTPAILGTINTLELARSKKIESYVFISSGEVYGNNSEADSKRTEDDKYSAEGMSPRSCYPVAKQAAETLCASYVSEYNVPVKVARLSHTYGPFVSKGDNRASTQFIQKAQKAEDIVLHSKGEQIRSYTYVADAVAGILTILLNGKDGEAYNVANPTSAVSIMEFAKELASLADVKCQIEAANENQQKERSPISSQVLGSDKLEELGFKWAYTLQEGLRVTLDALK